jgi:hypothetical protein
VLLPVVAQADSPLLGIREADPIQRLEPHSAKSVGGIDEGGSTASTRKPSASAVS